ncbi:AcrR family transcriptional regulator [Fontibacillus solani]|uniref:AcrR family transcriptional regulator n=1 Tax=Fontibacillus solani TaxID=1572857 RepID=A0A7W3XSN1_9BACL|nr:TetR/AcrR family transcriptional regulator [Fontibacillus solani]MBA9086721.1 AcrR family transcriptional regulator [Fontibacillus solani]
MDKNKKQLQSEQTKSRIAEAARSLFAQKGYKATSIEDIVEATGSSKGNIYYHFKSKEGLFLHLINEWDQEWEIKWGEKEPKYTTSIEKLYGIAEHLVLDDLNHPLTKAADDFFNNEEKTSEVEERMNEMLERHLKFNRTLLQQGVDSGEFKPQDVNSLAIVLESLIIGLGQMSSKKKENMKEILDLYRLAFSVLLHGIAESEPTTSP